MDWTVLTSIALGLMLLMTVAWAIQRVTASSGWIDTIWSFGVGLGGMAAALLASGDAERRVVTFFLVGIWSFRLGLHIARRTHGAAEDPRYAKMIEDWGSGAAFRLWLFLQVQALAAFVLVLGVYLAAISTEEFPRWVDLLAVAIAVIAVAGETVADRQLAAYRKTPEAKTGVIETGLWRYSRHPNYFFEWLFWCAWPLMAISIDDGWTWLALLAPLQMYWLLVHVSGIPPLEEHMAASRGDKFRAVQARVNAFFPGPRRKEIRT